MNIESLDKSIRHAGAWWDTASTSISRLSEAELETRLCGTPMDRTQTEATQRAVAAITDLEGFGSALPSLPGAVDWRQRNGDWTTRVRDQGACSSGVAFGVIDALECRALIAKGVPDQNFQLSAAHLFYCGCGACCHNGWSLHAALDYCRNTGVAMERDFPYVAADSACPSGLHPAVRLRSWSQVLGSGERRATLANRGPMVAIMDVYRDFTAYAGGVYRRATEELLGGPLVVCVVGYDDFAQCWICKNHWGQAWGEAGPAGSRGWFRIAYGQCGIDTKYAFYDLDLSPVPTDPCARQLPQLQRVIAACRFNRALRDCLLFHVCGTGRRVLCSANTRPVVDRVAAILRVCPHLRPQFCRAVARS
jgi:C1A family cysteine protease